MESSNFNKNNCVIYFGDFSTSTEKAAVVTKGIPSLTEFCKIRGDTLFQDHLEKQNEQEPVGRMLVHPKSCRAYADPERAKRSSDSAPQPSSKKSILRSHWKTHCFFCNKKVIIEDSKHENWHPESRRVGGKEESV